jgi:hypothetical protein
MIPIALKSPSSEALKNLRSLRQQFGAEVGYTPTPARFTRGSHSQHSHDDNDNDEEEEEGNSSLNSFVPFLSHGNGEQMRNTRSVRPTPSDKWFLPKIYSENSLSVERHDDDTSTTSSSQQSTVSSISQPLSVPKAPNLNEKECQTMEAEFVTAPPPPRSHPFPPRKNSTSSVELLPQPTLSLPATAPPSQQVDDESCCDTDSDMDDDHHHDHDHDHGGEKKGSIPKHDHTTSVTHSNHQDQQAQPPQQRPYFYEDKWLHPHLHSHSPVSSVASIPPLDQEKENHSIQSSSSASLPLREKYSTHRDSHPRPRPGAPDHDEVIHVDAPHTHLILTPYEINVQRKYSNNSQPSPTYFPQKLHSSTHEPFAPIQRVTQSSTAQARHQPSSFSQPSLSSHGPRERRSEPQLSSRLSSKYEQGYAPPRDTLDLSNLSFEVSAPPSPPPPLSLLHSLFLSL